MSKPFQRNLEEETVGETVTLDIVRRRGKNFLNILTYFSAII